MRPAESSPSELTARSWRTPCGVAVAATFVAAVGSYALPPTWAATGVGLCFLSFTYWAALRDDDGSRARHFGLSLGGLLEFAPLSAARLARSGFRALTISLAVALVVFPLFWIGFAWWWEPRQAFRVTAPPGLLDDVVGQILVVALPEEAFYRGYLQTAFDDAWPRRVRVLGARLGPGILVASVLFAAGHWLTDMNPGRLAVFFPSLLFGWLRVRSGSIAAPLLLHAASNLFASFLGRGYGLFQ